MFRPRTIDLNERMSVMEYCERRQTLRYVMRIPLNFRELSSPQTAKQFGEIINVSPGGVCFLARVTPSVGAAVGVFLKIPAEVIGKPSPEWQWTGQVVHVRFGNVPEGSSYVGVRFIACDSVE
jgi:PilZ domain